MKLFGLWNFWFYIFVQICFELFYKLTGIIIFFRFKQANSFAITFICQFILFVMV